MSALDRSPDDIKVVIHFPKYDSPVPQKYKLFLTSKAKEFANQQGNYNGCVQLR